MTAALTELDPHTITALTPPCACIDNDQPCPRPAAWITHIWINQRPTDPLLTCDPHGQAAADHARHCPRCQRFMRVELEPIGGTR